MVCIGGMIANASAADSDYLAYGSYGTSGPQRLSPGETYTFEIEVLKAGLIVIDIRTQEFTPSYPRVHSRDGISDEHFTHLPNGLFRFSRFMYPGYYEIEFSSSDEERGGAF